MSYSRYTSVVQALVGVFAVCVLAAGCVSRTNTSSESGGTDSNTHWLDRCDEDTDCESGLSCLCGMCTRTCEDEDSCDELGRGGLCIEHSCAGNPLAALCSKTCEGDADCGSGAQCSAGTCESEASTDPEAEPTDDTNTEDPTDEPTGTGDCVGDECTEPLEGADKFPEGCEVLLPRASSSTCVNGAEICEQAQIEEREREFLFLGGDVTVATCVYEFLVASGFEPRLSDDWVYVTALGSELSALTEASALRYEVGCGEDLCDDCFAADEEGCAADAFCSARMGTPIDVDAQCREERRFSACIPVGTLCDEAEGDALDANGQCWHVNSLCYEPGWTYEDVPDSCAFFDTPCGSSPVQPTVCRALETTTTNDACLSPGLVSFDGEECYNLSCGCVGEDCDQIWSTLGACETANVGCGDELPVCEDLGLPSQAISVARVTYVPDTDFEEFAEWTSAEWGGVVELPALPEPCDPVEVNGRTGWCGFARGVSFMQGDVTLLSMNVNAAGLERIALETGTPVEFKLGPFELFVRDPETGEPYLMLYSGQNADNPLFQQWNTGTVRVRADVPHCTREITGCGGHAVVQRLAVLSLEGPETEWFETEIDSLTPVTEKEIRFDSPAGEALSFHVSYGQSQHNQPEICDPEARVDSFSLVRVLPTD